MSTVGDLLRSKGSEVHTVAPETSILRVAQRMRLEHIGALVVSTDGNRLEGTISERDIVFGFARHGGAVAEMAVSDLMSRTVATCAPGDPVRSAMRTMTNARVRHLPVIEAGELRGIISIGDVVKAGIDDADLEAHVMRDAYLASRAR